MPDQFNALSPFELMLLYRGDAIGTYGALEQSLAKCFVTLSRTEDKIGMLIFFKIVNNRTRYSIIEELLKDQHYPNYKKFWSSIFKHLRDIDDQRNKIVHWIPVLELPVDENGVASVDQRKSKQTWLQPPNYWQKVAGKKPLSVNDVLAFRHKADFITKHLDLWYMFVNRVETVALQTFENRFQQPILYPPPKDHPLYEPLPVWKNQPQSSQE